MGLKRPFPILRVSSRTRRWWWTPRTDESSTSGTTEGKPRYLCISQLSRLWRTMSTSKNALTAAVLTGCTPVHRSNGYLRQKCQLMWTSNVYALIVWRLVITPSAVTQNRCEPLQGVAESITLSCMNTFKRCDDRYQTQTQRASENQAAETSKERKPEVKCNGIKSSSLLYFNIVPDRVRSNGRVLLVNAFQDQGSSAALCDQRLLVVLNVLSEDISFGLTTVGCATHQMKGKRQVYCGTCWWKIYWFAQCCIGKCLANV